MQSSTQSASESKGMLWTGRVLSGLMALFLVLDGVGHLMKPAPVVEAFARLGYPLSASVGIGLLALICTAIYVTPRTSVLGAILLTGYMGGAVSTHMCALAQRCSRRSFRSSLARWCGWESMCEMQRCVNSFPCDAKPTGRLRRWSCQTGSDFRLRFFAKRWRYLG